jgi:hypothetical protein
MSKLFIINNLKRNYFGAISLPCCSKAPTENHIEFLNENWLMRTSGSSIQGNGLSHSVGERRPMINCKNF